MGSCLCKERRRDSNNGPGDGAYECRRGRSTADRTSRRRGRESHDDRETLTSSPRDSTMVSNDVRELIRQTLKVIRTLVNNEQEPPPSLMKLNMIADKEAGWLLIVKALIDTVPDADSLGPAVITLFLDECPLPSKETIHRLLYSLALGSAQTEKLDAGWHKNACIVLGSLAEKLAGSSSVSMCSSTTLQYLINNLHPTRPRQVILFSLVALEKFAQTSENQFMISRTFASRPEHPLRVLERWLSDPSLRINFTAQQVAFCAQWSLDNIFVTEDRVFSYRSANVTDVNAMLNHEDVSEYLKIGPDGLEARCDVSSFESVRCTFEVQEGVWYYEALVLTPGVMQIGFATKRSKFLNHEGYGIGDDESSVAYDGCRQLLWHNAHSIKHEHPPWKSGDVVGCLLDLPQNTVMFYLNGMPLKHAHSEFLIGRLVGEGVFAAASFMSFQQCRFNFGARPFKFPPFVPFRTFNNGGAVLSKEQKTILPRRCRLEMLIRETIPEDSCQICFARPSDTVLLPCEHGGMCHACSLQVEQCPLCRTQIEARRPSSLTRSQSQTSTKMRVESVI